MATCIKEYGAPDTTSKVERDDNNERATRMKAMYLRLFPRCHEFAR